MTRKILIFSSLHIYFYFFNSLFDKFHTLFSLTFLSKNYSNHDKKTPVEHFLKYLFLFYFIWLRRWWLACGVSRVETSSNPAAALTPPCGFSFVSPYRKKSCDFFRGLRIFLCKSFKRYRGIIRTDCDYRKQSTPNGVGTPPLFNGEKMNFYWGGMSPQPPMLLLKGPQSTNSTSQIKDLESHWESNQNPFWGVPFPASQ